MLAGSGSGLEQPTKAHLERKKHSLSIQNFRYELNKHQPTRILTKKNYKNPKTEI